MRRFLLALPLLALAACSSDGGGGRSLGEIRDEVPSYISTVQLLGANGELRGIARLEQRLAGTRVEAKVEGLTQGLYAIHIHAVGRCDAPTFESAGAHFNPASRQHGKNNPQGPHAGDLPNIEIGADGAGRIDHLVPGLKLTGDAGAAIDADGAAILVHAGADDYRTDPSGNSGARIACGTLAAGR